MEAWEVVKALEEGKKMKHPTLGKYFYKENDALWMAVDDMAGEVNHFTLEELKFFEGWIEYIEPLKVGDFLFHDHNGHIAIGEVMNEDLVKWSDGIENDVEYIQELVDDEIIRKATQEEIKAEKERRKWHSIGRELKEFKVGDIVYMPYMNYMDITAGPYEVLCSNPLVIKNDGDGSYDYDHDDLKLVVPVESRFDIN